MKKTAIIAIAAILVFAPFQAVHAAPPADYEKQIAILKTQIEILQMKLAKLQLLEERIIPKKEKELPTKAKIMEEKEWELIPEKGIWVKRDEAGKIIQSKKATKKDLLAQ